MKKIYALLMVLTLGSLAPLCAQTYFGFQSIGVHTWFFSLSWQGKAAHIGLGYNLRNTNRTYTDWQLEWRLPLRKRAMLREQNELIVGFYQPLRPRRTFIGMGVHAKIQTQSQGAQRVTNFGLNLAAIPTYIFAAPLPANAFRGSMALRVAYQPILLSRVLTSGEVKWQGLTGQRVELGGHLDAHFDGTLMLANHTYATRGWYKKDVANWNPVDRAWRVDGDVYAGSTYYIRRW